MSVAGLRCPLCGSWYTDEEWSHVFFEVGEVCGNQAMTGPHPELCSPDHPCPGILVPEGSEAAKKILDDPGW